MKIKMNSRTIILADIVCLMPLILSALMYNNLPAKIAIHFDAAGNPDNYVSKFIGAFLLPIMLALINFITYIIISNDPKKQNQSEILQIIGIWTCPVLSLILTPITLFTAAGYNIPINLIVNSSVGILLIIVGNYLPKCKHNYTVGIKLPWTLSDEENWNKTHHISGYLWIVGGIIITLAAFFNFNSLVLVTLFIIIIIPGFYSYNLYKKKQK